MIEVFLAAASFLMICLGIRVIATIPEERPKRQIKENNKFDPAYFDEKTHWLEEKK